MCEIVARLFDNAIDNVLFYRNNRQKAINFHEAISFICADFPFDHHKHAGPESRHVPFISFLLIEVRSKGFATKFFYPGISYDPRKSKIESES